MITIYSKDMCPYCDGAKGYLNKIGQEYIEVNVTHDMDLKLWLKEQGHKTVPQIYYQGQLFVEGGFEGLSKMLPNDIEERKRVINESL
jgi:glutaredoxin